MLETCAGVKIGGVNRLTTIDYPEHLAAVVFTQGCPWRCPYCHNWPLLDVNDEDAVKWSSVLDILRRRKDFLDGVVFSGGEPTLWPELGCCLEEVVKMGFDVALHTNGAFPERLKNILKKGLVNWVAMDIKAPFEEYQDITGVPHSGEAARKSAGILLSSEVDVEFRTTVHPEMLSRKQVADIAETLYNLGAGKYVIQKCRTEYCRVPFMRAVAPDFNSYLLSIRRDIKPFFPYLEIR